MKPDNPEYYYSLGNICFKLCRFDTALEAYQNAVKIDLHDYESWLNLSEIYYKKNLLSKAIKTLEEAHKSNPGIALINYRLAAFYFLRHDFSAGIVYLKKGVTINHKEHKELLKFCPDAFRIEEVAQLVGQYLKSKS
jgi:tetratricopeptide (TPR) repeat protein